MKQSFRIRHSPARSMWMTILSLLIAVTSACSPVATPSPQERAGYTGQVSGLAYADTQGSGEQTVRLAQLQVFLREANSGKVAASGVTDETGSYRFATLAPGTYELCWEMEAWGGGCDEEAVVVGKEPVWNQPLVVSPNLSYGAEQASVRPLAGRLVTEDGTSLYMNPDWIETTGSPVAITDEEGAPIHTPIYLNRYGQYLFPDLPENANVLRFSAEDVLATSPITGTEINLVASADQVAGLEEVSAASELCDSLVTWSQEVHKDFHMMGVPDDSCDFLFRAGISDRTRATKYYKAVDPLGQRTTLGCWWKANGFGEDGKQSNAMPRCDMPSESICEKTFKLDECIEVTEEEWRERSGFAAGATKSDVIYVNSVFINTNLLGYGRDMNCLRRGENVACYVGNIGPALGVQKPPSALLSVEQALDVHYVNATVAMEFSHIEGREDGPRVVKFFVFGGGGTYAGRRAAASLDGLTARFVPDLCFQCHGGEFVETLDARVYGASFREFGEGGLRFSNSDGLSDLQRHEALRTLNEIVLATKPPVDAITKTIEGWYGGCSEDAAAPGTFHCIRDTQDRDYIPEAWESEEELYKRVIGPYCYSCHIVHTMTADMIAGEDARKIIYDRVFGDGNGIKDPVMPHSWIAYRDFWLDQDAVDMLRQYLASPPPPAAP